MRSLRWGAVLLAIAILGGALSTACHPTFIVVPAPGQDTVIDTVEVDGVRTRVMRITRVDTVVRLDTVFQTRTLLRVDSAVRVDTVMRVDTIHRTRTVARVDTVLRVDTLRTTRVDTLLRVDTVRLTRVDTVPITRVDTVRLTRVDTLLRLDTVRVTLVDTVFRSDTVLVAGQRVLFVPPGHYPPEGQCRIWIHDLPPGRQADAAACTGLRDIPPGAFILFAGEAWDFDYDWIWESERNPGTVPPEILAVTRRGSR